MYSTEDIKMGSRTLVLLLMLSVILSMQSVVRSLVNAYPPFHDPYPEENEPAKFEETLESQTEDNFQENLESQTEAQEAINDIQEVTDTPQVPHMDESEAETRKLLRRNKLRSTGK